MIRFYSNFNDRFKKNKRCRTVNLEKTQGHGENHPFAITSDCEHILHVCAKKKNSNHKEKQLCMEFLPILEQCNYSNNSR